MAAARERRETSPGGNTLGGTAWPILLVWGLLACQLVLGGLYAIAELGELPHYHDSNAYFELARILRVDAHRGIAYPVFLAILDGFGSPSFLGVIEHEHTGKPCTAPGRIVLVQLLQFAACAAAFAYWLRTAAVVSPRATTHRRTGPLAIAAVCALLSTDPLIAHFALSVMPDALAMAASLAFCSALSRVALADPERRTTTRDGILVFAAFTVASLLRPEKKFVLAAAALAAAAVWPLLAHRGALSLSRFPARIGFLAALVGLAFVTTTATEQRTFRDYGRPGQTTIMLHARVIFPHLGDIFDALPANIQRRFTPADVAFYDTHILNPGPVMERITAGDREEFDRLTAQIAQVAWRERGGSIVFDTVKDGLENTVPTPAFYARMLALEELGVPGYRQLSRSDMLPWTRKLMSDHHPRLFAGSLLVAGATFFLLGGWLLGRRLVGGRVAPERTWPGELLPWLPTLTFALANAAAFALHADAVSPRYNLSTHAIVLAVVYTNALRVARMETRP